MPWPKKRRTYEIINALTGNTLYSIDNKTAAIDEYENVIFEDPDHRAPVTLVSFDEAGNALEKLRGPA